MAGLDSLMAWTGVTKFNCKAISQSLSDCVSIFLPVLVAGRIKVLSNSSYSLQTSPPNLPF